MRGKVQIVERGELAIIRLQGELTLGEAQTLREGIKGLVQRGFRYLLMDFSKATFIDSAGLNVLISAKRIFRSRGGDLGLFGLNRAISEVFEMTQLDKIIDMFPDEGEAVRSFLLHRGPSGRTGE
ncbi:MAG: STAS domain-containing protein [bacterium]